jgi:hypothetical protein
MIQFHQGQGDVTLLKPSGRTLNVTIGPGLPSSTSELLDAVHACYTQCFYATNFGKINEGTN